MQYSMWMSSPSKYTMDAEAAQNMSVEVAQVFQPRTPINTRELFAGRWEQIQTLVDAVAQNGLHVVIYGERGVGKTSLANIVRPLIHVFDGTIDEQDQSRLIIKTNAGSSDSFSSLWRKLFGEISLKDNRPVTGIVPGERAPRPFLDALNFQEPLEVDQVRKGLAILPNAVFIIDEFDRIATREAANFTDLIKSLSDFSVNCTVILVGVSDTIDELVSDHGSITRAVTQILLPRMGVNELQEILDTAEKRLQIKFSNDARDLIVHISQGLPHYTHLIGLNSVRKAANRHSTYIARGDVFDALKGAVGQAQQSVTQKHSKAIHSAHQALYREVLLACALTASQTQDPLGYFTPGAVAGPLAKVLDREVKIATYNNHLSEFCQKKRSEVLERDGQLRAYRFRFRDPLLVPFVFMDAVSKGLVNDADLAGLIKGS